MNRYISNESTKATQQNIQRENSNRAAELDELNFSDDESARSFADVENESITQDDSFARDLTDIAMPGDDPTNDDMSPETLILEDGARSPHESGEDEAIDQSFTIVGEREIGGGNGLDEAELGRLKPLDGKRWDGDHDEPLDAATGLHENFAVINDSSGNHH